MGRFALACASHTPLLMKAEYASPEIVTQVRQSFDQLASSIREFKPDHIIQFAPDHFHGFRYNMMPSFCVGAGAHSWGDWGTAKGPLNVDEAFALQMLDWIRAADIDAAVSYDMPVDHGFVQMWETLFGGFAELPIIPIFVNAIGFPIPTYRRARMLGEAVGRFARQTDKRILFAASGGLSHDPMVPRIHSADADLRDRLIGRKELGPEQQAAREQMLHGVAAATAKGEGPIRPLNPEWDRAFLTTLTRADWAAIDAMTAEQVDAVAGAGGNEVLAWVAAAAAMAAAADATETLQQDYQPVPGWIAGFGILFQAAASAG